MTPHLLSAILIFRLCILTVISVFLTDVVAICAFVFIQIILPALIKCRTCRQLTEDRTSGFLKHLTLQ
jgi:hypothetical protein